MNTNGAKQRVVRTFIAIQPSPEVLTSLSELQRQLRPIFTSEAFRWVNPKQIHLTLKFLGDIPEDWIGSLKSAVQTACAESRVVRLSAKGLGIFPDLRRPAVLWVGLRGDVETLESLQAEIEKHTVAFGKPENREFHPHLTLARIKDIGPKKRVKLQKEIESGGGKSYGEWNAKSVYLMESKLSAKGAEHFALAEFALGGKCYTP